MRVKFTSIAAVAPMVLVVGCGGSGQPPTPLTDSSTVSEYLGSGKEVDASASTRLVNMKDACDPDTFNAAIGPGTCIDRESGVSFSQFIAELTRTQMAGAWHFAPMKTTARSGQTLLAINRGGEVHTFTRVAAFGGGIVPQLNNLSGNPVPAPECQQLDPDDFVMPGGTYEAVLPEPGTQHFQCCIHPWMRTTVRAR